MKRERTYNRIEQEAVYLLREAVDKKNMLTFLCEDQKEKEALLQLTMEALYPERPQVVFCEESPNNYAELKELRPTGQERTLLFCKEKAELLHRAQMWHLYNLSKAPGDSLILRPFLGLGKKIIQCRDKKIVKLITCGGVDDGKSTLIGRLLYESKTKEEQEELYKRKEFLRGDGSLDYAVLASESKEESEQGITITVSYSWFETKSHAFLMADTPGHEEYTRNMAFGASGADLAIIMISGKKGIVPQTKRHIRICSFMGIRKFIFAVNKMDLCGYDQGVFLQVEEEIHQYMEQFPHQKIRIIPVAAKAGDNISRASENLDWYHGMSLLDEIDDMERVKEKEPENGGQEAFIGRISHVCKSSQQKNNPILKRHYLGEVTSGNVKPGDQIYVLPGESKAIVTSLFLGGKAEEKASVGDDFAITLDNELNISPGSILTTCQDFHMEDRFKIDVLWMADQRLKNGNRYYVKYGSLTVPATVTRIKYIFDSYSGERRSASFLTKNMFARCEISLLTKIPVFFQEGKEKPQILFVDMSTNETAGYGRLVANLFEENLFTDDRLIQMEERENALGQHALLLLAPQKEEAKVFLNTLEDKLIRSGLHTMHLRREDGEGPIEKDRIKEKITTLMEAGLIVLYEASSEETADLLASEMIQRRYLMLSDVTNHLEVLGKSYKRVMEELGFLDEKN